METPDYALHLTDWPNQEDPDKQMVAERRAQAAQAVQDISAFFVYVQDLQPKLRLVRMRAVRFLMDCGWTKQEITDNTGMSLHRINEVLKTKPRD